uniref:C2H2-type domain-containing protein n=1 Tax=Setaria digitata TaxID=48799 RepID=A0A915PJD2_9BILA
MEFTLCIMTYVYIEQLENNLGTTLLMSVIRDHSEHNDISRALKHLHRQGHCCGSQSFEDWRDSVWWQKVNSASELKQRSFDLAVPDFCCRSERPNCGRRDHPSNIYYNGCLSYLMKVVKEHLLIICGASFALALVQIFGIGFGICLYIKWRDFLEFRPSQEVKMHAKLCPFTVQQGVVKGKHNCLLVCVTLVIHCFGKLKISSTMSMKRKQFKPKAFKDDEVVSSDLHSDQEVREKKRKQIIGDGGSEISGEGTDSCPESFVSTKAMDMQIVCSFCETRFDNIKALQNHTLQNHQHQQIVKMENEEGDIIPLNKEISQTRDIAPSLVCQQCDATLYGFAEFGCHMRTHLINKDDEQKCSLCDANFIDPAVISPNISYCGAFHGEQHSYTMQRMSSGTILQFSANATASLRHTLGDTVPLCYMSSNIQQPTPFPGIPFLIKEHSVTHIEEVLRYYCAACSIPFETRDLLAVHVQLIHDRPTAALTVNHFQKSSSEDNFCKQQAAFQTESRLVKCLVCDIKFESDDELDFHRLVVHCKVPRSNRCADCQAQIQTVTHFKDHIREHMQGERNVTCIICRQALRNDAQIDTHAKYHLQFSDDICGPDQQCGICQQLIPRETLELHVVEHSSNGDCPYCGKHFSSTESLLAHIDSTHLDVKAAYQCHKCRQTFHFKSQLQHHHCLAVAHETLHNSIRERIPPVLDQQQTYQCPYCSKIFGSESALQGHSHVHSTRAFRCDLCVLSFSSSQRLETHRKKHFAEKDFTCQICDLKFLKNIFKISIHAHMISRYFSRNDLSLHVKMHGGTLSRCSIEPAMKIHFN